MSQKKSFWKRLLSGETEQTELSLTEVNSIRNTLHDEYGLSISTDNTTAEELDEHHYRKVAGEELARISQIFQYVPQIAANSLTRNAVETAFKSATEGTYRVRLGAGMHLCRSHLTPGAYRAVGLNNVTNKITGNAELFANDAALTISNAPQLALGFFNVASIVTGQYFMSQVNSKLASLTTSVGKLEKMLDAQRLGELKAIAQELEDIREKSEYIIADTDKTNEAISQLHDIQRVASKSMNTSQELVINELSSCSNKDKIEVIEAHRKCVVKYLIEYQYATQIYGIATLLEVQMRNITDPDELVVFREQINKRVVQYKTAQEKAERTIEEYLDKTHVLNDRSVLQWVTSGLAGFVSVASTGWPGVLTGTGAKVFSCVDDLFNDHQKAQKAEISNEIHSDFVPLKDPAFLDSPASSIDLFINSVGREIEYVRIGDDYYTNLPEV